MENRHKKTIERIKRRRSAYRKAIAKWKEKKRKNPAYDLGPNIKKYG
jgi:hypothetical protein